ncbi:MAG TPA: glycosyltransferase [Solimonas sp.]
MTHAPTVAVLLPDLRSGGGERLHVTLATEWLRRGVGVEFVLRQARGELLPLLPAGVTVVDLGARRVRDALSPLVAYLKHARPQALLAAMWPLTVLAPLAARMAGFRGRVVVSEHSPLSIAYGRRGRLHRLALRGSQRLLYPLADARVAVSAGVADDLARLSGLPRTRFQVIHNPAATGRATCSADTQDPFGDSPRPRVLTVGRMKSVKRHDLLLDAFALLPAERRGTLCIVGDGDGEERAQLKARVERLGLGGQVLLPGFVADPSPYYAAADLFVLSSDYEGFGNVLVEAMEFGLPVVSTDCVAGPREVLDNGRLGTLVVPGDAQALACGMKAAMGAPVDRAALRARASEFGAGVIAERYLDSILPGWRRDDV